MKVGDTASVSLMVETKHTAKAISIDPNDDFPAVYATANMIALMELSAARLMKHLLKAEQLSVGVGVNVLHLAATLVGEEVTATATFLGMKGKLYHFAVELTDRGGIAGKGEHTRAIIDTDRLMEGARKRMEKTK